MTPAAISEKRSEVRQPAEGPVWVHFANPQSIEIQGELKDISPSGFRMAHGYASLEAGQVVEFSMMSVHGARRGSARAMWNRISGQNVETGFLIVTNK
jgi:hypothetical protein